MGKGIREGIRMKKQMKIAVAGIGYVGLANAVLLARDNAVCAVDIVEEKADMINRRQSPVAEDGLEAYLREVPLNLRATTNAEAAYEDADFIVIVTPTDYDPEKNRFDTTSVETVAEQAHRVNPDACIVIKSTVPAGYTRKLCSRFRTERILFSPEFLREGKTLEDSLYPSRIIMGVDAGSGFQMEKGRIFAGLLTDAALKQEVPVLYMDPSEAEAVKLFANAYLAMRVAFFNELDTYAQVYGLNSGNIIDGVCLDSRIGDHYNNPSFGYGGYCLPKDTRQLRADYGNIPNSLISSIVDANDIRKNFIAEQVLKKSGTVTGIYRLTMKADSDNFRHAAILGVMQRLAASNARMVIYEPAVSDRSFMGIRVIRSLEEFKRISDVIVANRYDEELEDVKDKIYTRDLFGCD